MGSDVLPLDLLFTLAGLLLGAVSYRLSRRRAELYACLDGFVLVGVAGLVLTEVLPASFTSVGGFPAGLWVILLAVAGFTLPFILERRLALLPFSPNAFFRWLMILGLFLHQILDGVALSEGESSLRLAVILHQIPKGFFIWALVGAAMGGQAGLFVIGGLCLATVGGFLLGDYLTVFTSSYPLALFQAFIGGGLLHVIVHHVPGGLVTSRGGKPVRVSRWSGAGALLSLGMLLWFPHDRPPTAEGADPVGVGGAFMEFCLLSAPSILLGFTAAGLFHAFLPRVISSWFRGKGRMSQALRGIAIGAPLPICSCGVAPVYLSLLKKNVPPAAALAFLIATPEIGIDSVFLSGKLLGLKITLIRLGMAFLIALAVGITLARTFEKIQRSGELDRMPLPKEDPLPEGFMGKLGKAIRFGGLEIVDHTGAWLLLGITVAAVLQSFVQLELFPQIPPVLDVLLLSLLGLPIYVCASGATPLAAALLQGGVSPGAVLAFLIIGPSTNITTFGILKRCHGLKGALLFAIAVYGFSIATGFAINYLIPGAYAVGEEVATSHEEGPLAWVSVGILAILFAGSLLRLGPRGFLATLFEGMGSTAGTDEGHSHSHHNDQDDHQRP